MEGLVLKTSTKWRSTFLSLQPRERCFTLKEAILSPGYWQILQAEFGGDKGHSLDLITLDINVKRNKQGKPLKHSTPFPTSESAELNFFNQDLRDCERITRYAYAVRVRFGLILPLLKYFLSQDVVATLAVPKLSPLSTPLHLWWPV